MVHWTHCHRHRSVRGRRARARSTLARLVNTAAVAVSPFSLSHVAAPGSRAIAVQAAISRSTHSNNLGRRGTSSSSRLALLSPSRRPNHHSSGPPPACHLARAAIQVIIRLAGQVPSRWRPLSSNVRRHQHSPVSTRSNSKKVNWLQVGAHLLVAWLLLLSSLATMFVPAYFMVRRFVPSSTIALNSTLQFFATVALVFVAVAVLVYSGLHLFLRAWFSYLSRLKPAVVRAVELRLPSVLNVPALQPQYARVRARFPRLRQ